MKSLITLAAVGFFALALNAAPAEAQNLGRFQTPGWVPQYKSNPGGNATSGTTIGSAPVPMAPRRTMQPAQQQPKQVYKATQGYTAKRNQVYQSQDGSKAYVPQYTPQTTGGFARQNSVNPPQNSARGAAAARTQSDINLYNKVYGSGPRRQ